MTVVMPEGVTGIPVWLMIREFVTPMSAVRLELSPYRITPTGMTPVSVGGQGLAWDDEGVTIVEVIPAEGIVPVNGTLRLETTIPSFSTRIRWQARLYLNGNGNTSVSGWGEPVDQFAFTTEPGQVTGIDLAKNRVTGVGGTLLDIPSNAITTAQALATFVRSVNGSRADSAGDVRVRPGWEYKGKFADAAARPTYGLAEAGALITQDDTPGTLFHWNGVAWVTIPIPGGGTGGPGAPQKLGHEHAQATAATTWTVDHNLGFKPGGITVVDPDGLQHFPRLNHVSGNQVVLTFDSAVSGTAYLS